MCKSRTEQRLEQGSIRWPSRRHVGEEKVTAHTTLLDNSRRPINDISALHSLKEHMNLRKILYDLTKMQK